MQAVLWEGELPLRIQSALGLEADCFQSYLDQNFIKVPLNRVFDLVAYLKDEEAFDMLVDLTAVDRPKAAASRFELFYILYSFTHNQRIRLKSALPEGQAAPSICSLFLGANWLEREAFDMFGISFTGHPDLRRMLLPEDWKGFPLRKDSSIVGMDQEWVQNNLGIESGQ